MTKERLANSVGFAKFSLISLILVSSFLFLAMFSSAFAGSNAAIWTTDADGNPQYDFPPSSIVYIHGSGFSSRANVQIEITRPDGLIETGSVSADWKGNFVYEYDLDGIDGLYTVEARDHYHTATTTFTDCVAICGNGKVEDIEECEPPNTAFCDSECHWKEMTCVQAKNAGYLTGSISGGTGTVINKTPFDYNVGLAVYEKFDEVIDHQSLFDFETGLVGGNNSLVLNVDLPACKYQIDLFCGSVLMSLDGQRYGTRLITAKLGGDPDYCGPKCGDGTLDEGEECDDGNTKNGDGCSSQCKIEPAKIIAFKIVCDNEPDLPNWGLGGPDITASTAQNFVNSHPNCHFEQDWKFQWAYSGTSNPGNQVGEAGTGWTTFGPTDGNGKASSEIKDLKGSDRIWVREVFKQGYIPFTYGGSNSNNISAELYCHKDVLNYDNYDYAVNPKLGKTYYCVAWNVLEGECTTDADCSHLDEDYCSGTKEVHKNGICVDNFCEVSTVENECNDGAYCNGQETCNSGTVSCEAGTPINCSYLNDQCNNGICDEGQDACIKDPVEDQTPCNDGLFCNEGEVCLQGICSNGSPKDCSEFNIFRIATCDWNPDDLWWTWDYRPEFISACNEETDACTLGDETINHTVNERCTECMTDADCSNTGNPCTTNKCVDYACVETPKPESTNCEADGDLCTIDHCDGQGSCVQFDEVSCLGLDDQCNTGTCNPSSGSCYANPLPWSTSCEDGLFCNGPDHCDGTGLCTPMSEPVDCSYLDDQCNEGVCDEGIDNCVQEPVDDYTPCDDGLFCNESEVCMDGECTNGSEKDCSEFNIFGIGTCFWSPDDLDYTWDYRPEFISECNEENDECSQGNWGITHTVDERCSECMVDDDCLVTGNECTENLCVEHSCVETPKQAGTSCELDGDHCTLDECNAQGECVTYDNIFVPPGEPCQSFYCDSADGQVKSDYSNYPLSTPCQADDDLCTIDHCNGTGSCVWKEDTPVPEDGQCNSYYCDSSDGEIKEDYTGYPYSTPCEAEGNLCTIDHCDGAGACTLLENVYVPEPEQCNLFFCDPSDGIVKEDYSNYPLSTPCEADDDVCTEDHCNGLGECVFLSSAVKKIETRKIVGTPKITCDYFGDGNEANECWFVVSGTQFTLEADYEGPSQVQTLYRIRWKENYGSGWGEWGALKPYGGPFTLPEDSIHELEYYSVDNVCDVNEPAHYEIDIVDNKAPAPNKVVGEPKEEWDGTSSVFYPGIAEQCGSTMDCWKVSLMTPIALQCTDQQPHPVNNEKVCFYVELDVDDATNAYCEEYGGDYNANGDGYCCMQSMVEEFYFTEESEHNLKYYCIDGLGNKGQTDDEKFKVSGKGFEIILNKKWNLVSVPFALLDSNIQKALSDIDGNVESVWSYDATIGTGGKWFVYRPGSPEASNLETIEPGWGYWIAMLEEDLLTIGGSLLSPIVTPASRQLKEGWNLIGYYGNDDLNGYYGPMGNGKEARCALWSLGESYLDKGWTSLLTYWEPYNPNQWIPYDYYDNMDPGAGYWVSATENSIYSYATRCEVP